MKVNEFTVIHILVKAQSMLLGNKERRKYTRAHPDPERTLFLPKPEKLLTERNKQLKELSTSSGNLVFEEAVFLEFEFKEEFQVLETPIKSHVDSILGKGKVLSDLEGSTLSFSEDRPSSKPAIVSSPRKPITPEAKNLILRHLMAHHNPPPPPPRVNPWVKSRYGPLKLPVNLHDMPNNYLNILPKFDGEKNVSAEDHMTAFQDFTDNMFMEHDDGASDRLQVYQDKMKALFDRKSKEGIFMPGDLVLRWDKRREDQGKHEKFDNL
eukprot:Gb_40851 [translate_table: standard]